MSHPNDITLKREEEKKLVNYKEYLDGLVNQNPPGTDIFSNRGAAHASILMATLMAHTTTKIDMYCTGLRPGILCGENEDDPEGFRGAYWEEFKRFFSETLKNDSFKSQSIRILIQTKDYIKNAPFREVSKALNNEATKDKIIVKHISNAWKEKIENELGKSGENFTFNYNFAIYDDRYFRLEYEADTYRALGSFRSDSLRKRLSMLFEDAFKNADEDLTEVVKGLTITSTAPSVFAPEVIPEDMKHSTKQSTTLSMPTLESNTEDVKQLTTSLPTPAPESITELNN